MTVVPPLQSLDLPEDVQDVLTHFVGQIEQQWHQDMDGLLLYGSAARGDFIAGRSNINILLIVQNVSVDQLQRVAQLHKEWGKHQIVAPLLMAKGDLERVPQLFPLEYLQMIQHYVVLAGQDPFGEVDLDKAKLGWQCEQELMANLLRVRQRFIEGEGRNEAIQALLILSITTVLSCLRGLLYCLGHTTQNKDLKILEMLPDTMQFDSSHFIQVLNIKRGLSSPGSLEWTKTYDRYLQSLEQLMERVQEIHLESS